MRLLCIVFLLFISSHIDAEDLWPDQVFLSITGEAAIQGDPTSQLLMGLFHELGWGVPQNFEEAARWYVDAIRNNNQMALRRLGMLTFFGLGVPKDEESGILMVLIGPHDDLFPNFNPRDRAKIEELRLIWRGIRSESSQKLRITQNHHHSRARNHRHQQQIPVVLASDRWDPMDANDRVYGPGTGDWNTGILRSDYERFQQDCKNLTVQINEFQDWADDKKAKDLRAQIERLLEKSTQYKHEAYQKFFFAVGAAMGAGLSVNVLPVALLTAYEAIEGFKNAAEIYATSVAIEKDAQRLLNIERSLEKAKSFGGRE